MTKPWALIVVLAGWPLLFALILLALNFAVQRARTKAGVSYDEPAPSEGAILWTARAAVLLWFVGGVWLITRLAHGA